jgi:UDP-glucuronate decarboxylase
MQNNAMTSFARQPWFLPVAVLIVIILWLQLSPSTGGKGGDGVGLGDSISHEQVKSLITSEIRSALIDTAKSTSTDGTKFPPVKVLPDSQRLRILVTGGSGFVGSHLVDRLMMQGHHVIVLDNMFTGRKKNIAQWVGHPNFQLIIHDVVERIMLEVDQIYHLACPASPPHYQYNPIKTIKTSTEGTLNMLGLAKRSKARMLLTSTSEVYGDPEVHPQKETYWGNVNPIGPRACYDEGKRVAETMMYAYESQAAVEVRVARIFNTFGPRMHPNDGRVVSNFIIQALQGKDITIYGNGKQTRSFQYVDDLVEGLMRLMNGNYSLPVNLGNPEEYTVKVRDCPFLCFFLLRRHTDAHSPLSFSLPFPPLPRNPQDFAVLIKELTKSNSTIQMLPATKDDPRQRRPDITTAKSKLGWEPRVPVRVGLAKAISYFAKELEESGEIVPTGSDPTKPNQKKQLGGF